jgi:hypothetical protein
MDPLTAALMLVTKAFELRMQWWASLSPAKQAELADKMADGELRWLDIVQKLVK